jgi:hypothetical protein
MNFMTAPMVPFTLMTPYVCQEVSILSVIYFGIEHHLKPTNNSNEQCWSNICAFFITWVPFYGAKFRSLLSSLYNDLFSRMNDMKLKVDATTVLTMALPIKTRHVTRYSTTFTAHSSQPIVFCSSCETNVQTLWSPRVKRFLVSN